MDQINIALCIDRGALIGTHVTLYTALDHMAPDCLLHIDLVHDNIDEDKLALLEKTLNSVGKPYTLATHCFSPLMFKNLRLMTGGWMAYVRLVLPDLLSWDRVLYLDADLLVYTDLKPLYSESLFGHPVGAITRGGPPQQESGLFQCLGLEMNQPYYNSGVLLMDLTEWRKRQLTQACLGFAEVHQQNLREHDQTIINCVFRDDIQPLPKKYNLPIYSPQKGVTREKLHDHIAHLIGRPKPWDPFGEFFNFQAPLYFEELKKTAVGGFRSYKNLDRNTLRRMLILMKSYIKCLAARF